MSARSLIDWDAWLRPVSDLLERNRALLERDFGLSGLRGTLGLTSSGRRAILLVSSEKTIRELGQTPSAAAAALSGAIEFAKREAQRKRGGDR